MIASNPATLRLAAAVVAFGACLTLSAPANAGPSDEMFLNDVRSVGNPGLTTIVDAAPDVVLDAGRTVCRMLHEGYGFQAVTGMVLDRLAMYGKSPGYDAGLVGVHAVAAYCPAHQQDSGFNDNY